MTFHDIMEALALPIVVLLFSIAYAALNWALTQKAVKNNTALNSVLLLLDHAAEAIIASLKTLPSTANKSDIINDIIEQIVKEFEESNPTLVKSAGISTETLTDYVKNRVCVNGEMGAHPVTIIPRNLMSAMKP